MMTVRIYINALESKILTLKFFKLASVRLATSLRTVSEVAIFLIHACYNASDAEILSAGLYVNNRITRSFASSVTSTHSGSSKVNCPYITDCMICLSLAPLNGG